MRKRLIPVTASLGFGIMNRAESKPKPAAQPAAQPESNAQQSARILVVDDDAAMLRLMNIRLRDAGYTVKTSHSVDEALDACPRFKPDLIISDLCMAPTGGLELLKVVQARWPGLCVIIQSGHGSIAAAVQATQNGAFGFLVKPINKEELLDQVSRALQVSSFAEIEGSWRAGIVSRSRLMDERISQANIAARSHDPILLTGEVGTGKELFARAIHQASSRREEPFHTVNCAALAAEEHAEHARDMFGLQTAGSVLLEDVQDLPIELQSRLLADLRHARSVINPGDTAPRSARLICSTFVDLEALVNKGKFRHDLYYEINVIAIEVPPLGRRREDIPLLIGHFLIQANVDDKPTKRYAPKAIELLTARNWPGNVDQLRRVVTKSIALSPTKIMTVEFVEQCLSDENVDSVPSFDQAREEFARNYLAQNLRITEGNVSQAARLSKRNRTDFYKLMARHNLQPEKFKKSESK